MKIKIIIFLILTTLSGDPDKVMEILINSENLEGLEDEIISVFSELSLGRSKIQTGDISDVIVEYFTHDFSKDFKSSELNLEEEIQNFIQENSIDSNFNDQQLEELFEKIEELFSTHISNSLADESDNDYDYCLQIITQTIIQKIIAIKDHQFITNINLQLELLKIAAFNLYQFGNQFGLMKILNDSLNTRFENTLQILKDEKNDEKIQEFIEHKNLVYQIFTQINDSLQNPEQQNTNMILDVLLISDTILVYKIKNISFNDYQLKLIQEFTEYVIEKFEKLNTTHEQKGHNYYHVLLSMFRQVGFQNSTKAQTSEFSTVDFKKTQQMKNFLLQKMFLNEQMTKIERIFFNYDLVSLIEENDVTQQMIDQWKGILFDIFILPTDMIYFLNVRNQFFRTNKNLNESKLVFSAINSYYQLFINFKYTYYNTQQHPYKVHNPDELNEEVLREFLNYLNNEYKGPYKFTFLIFSFKMHNDYDFIMPSVEEITQEDEEIMEELWNHKDFAALLKMTIKLLPEKRDGNLFEIFANQKINHDILQKQKEFGLQ